MPRPAPLMPAAEDFERPPVVENGAGRIRSVGVEIEFAGLSAEAAARAIAAELDEPVQEEDPHLFVVQSGSLGPIRIELDNRYLHPERKPSLLGGVVPALAAWVGAAASLVVPSEVVTAPIPIDRLPEVDRLVGALRAAGAKGTQDGALYAFGLHFNIETPRREAATIVATLKAFVLLNPWLRRQVAPDATRSLLGFADPFPAPYIRRIAAPDYWPEMPALIQDYIAANPTRNRDLDLLPLLLHLDEDAVRSVLPNEKINARPAFHYRLPDARVSDPGWSIAPDWNRWVAVERLAADRERLDSVGLSYLSFEGQDKSWADIVERIAIR